MIKAQGIYFSYTGASPYILSGLNFEINKGAYVSVVGDNGSGKSTLIRLILRLIKPVHGSITTTARRIGYVPQQRSNSELGFPMTVFEMLNSYRHLLKIGDKQVISQLLNQVGMSGYENALTGSLSGGQSQKTLIARAIMGDPDLLVLDEPSTGIDSASQSEIYKILRQLNTEKNITIVSVEHNLSAAISNSTLIYHLSRGKGHICTPVQYTDEFLSPNGNRNRVI